MWRHRATCSHCGLRSRWNRDREVSEAEILAHLKDSHNRRKPAGTPTIIRWSGSANATLAWSRMWMTAPSAVRISATCTPGISTACAAGASEEKHLAFLRFFGRFSSLRMTRQAAVADRQGSMNGRAGKTLWHLAANQRSSPSSGIYSGQASVAVDPGVGQVSRYLRRLVCKEKTEAGGRGHWDTGRPPAPAGFPGCLRHGPGGLGPTPGVGLEAPGSGAARSNRAINPGRTNRRAMAGQELCLQGTVFILISRSRIYQPYRRNFEITLSGFSFFGVAGGNAAPNRPEKRTNQAAGRKKP